MVTPLAGVWIEIIAIVIGYVVINVTPLAGVWIEIETVYSSSGLSKSLPLRECGLKSDADCCRCNI